MWQGAIFRNRENERCSKIKNFKKALLGLIENYLRLRRPANLSAALALWELKKRPNPSKTYGHFDGFGRFLVKSMEYVVEIFNIAFVVNFNFFFFVELSSLFFISRR